MKVVNNMRVVEKKCPNCGAHLEFQENDKNCKCSYCHSTFQIEKDEKESNDFEKSFQLKKLEGPMKIFATYFVANYIITGIIFLVVFIGVGFLIFRGVSSMNRKVFIQNASEITNEQYGDLDHKAYWAISKNDDGIHEYHLNLTVKRMALYVGYNKEKKKNVIIPVYKATYEKPLDYENIYSIYVPIAYENIYNNSSFVFQLDNGKIDAPEYYFNMEHSEYSYGYQTLEDLEKDYIEKLKKDYKITKK